MYVQVLQQLDAAQGSVEDMDEWLGIFNVKLRHMREDIESVYMLSQSYFWGEGIMFFESILGNFILPAFSSLLLATVVLNCH